VNAKADDVAALRRQVRGLERALAREREVSAQARLVAMRL
jgi:hypothetical protein